MPDWLVGKSPTIYCQQETLEIIETFSNYKRFNISRIYDNQLEKYMHLTIDLFYDACITLITKPDETLQENYKPMSHEYKHKNLNKI